MQPSIKNNNKLDPYEWYRTSALNRSKVAKGAEKLAYEIFGHDLIASMSFYLDASVKIPKIPRRADVPLRYRKRDHADQFFNGQFDKRVRSRTNNRIIGITPYTYYPLLDTWEPTNNAYGIVTVKFTNYDVASPLPVQRIPDFSFDTVSSKRTKLTKKWGGPFEKFENAYRIPKLTNARTSLISTTNVDSRSANDSVDKTKMSMSAYCRLKYSDQLIWQGREKLRADEMMSKHALSMVKGVMPDATRFDLARSIAELKDFRTTKKPAQLIEELREKFKSAKGNADLFLTEQFGILPLISDARKWMELPDKISKQVNFLLSRSGKPTTLHAKRILETPAWSNTPMQTTGSVNLPFFFKQHESAYISESELRLMVNVNFEFPPVTLPGLQDERIRKLWGANPSLTTVYNLVPWTWLIDWFTGFGHYLDMIEAFHNSETIINYGFLTYHSRGSVKTGYSLSSTSEIIQTTRPPTYVDNSSFIKTSTAIASWDYEYQKRVWLQDVDVHSASAPEFITSGFQKSIILALFGQRLL